MNQSSIQQHFLLSKPGGKRLRTDIEDELSKKSMKKDPNIPSTKLKSLLTPISHIPSLSSETLSIIDSLNLEKAAPSVDHILTNIPAKEKYAELLDPLRSFPLPYHYKKLVSTIELIDKAINYFNLIKQESTLYAISQYIHEKCKTSFNIEILQQIMHVFDAYSIS